MAALSPHVRRHLEMDIPSPKFQQSSAPTGPPPLSDGRHATRLRTRFAAEFSGTPRGAPATDREIRQLYVARPNAEELSRRADALLSPRLRLQAAEHIHKTPYDPRLLVSTQQLSFKPIDRDTAIAARYRGVESNYHKTRDELTEYTEAVLRKRHIEKLYSNTRQSK